MSLNYLGDAGASGDFFGVDPRFFQVVAPLSNLVIVVNNITPGVFNAPFHLTVEGYTDAAFTEPVPEPGTLFFAGTVLILFAGYKRRHYLRVRRLLAPIAAVSFAFCAFAQDIGPQARQQIAEILNAKRQLSAAQQKMDSPLAFASAVAGNRLSATSLPGVISAGQVPVVVDIGARVSDSLVDRIIALGGTVIDRSDLWGTIRASLPLPALEALADRPDVTSISSKAEGTTNAGALTSQGVIAHQANVVINNMGYDGSGVTIGVLSDSATPARIAALIASGDLPPGTAVLPGQGGSATGSDEGTAMMEIVHDLAPGARLIFATANTGVTAFASNILALQAAGARVIVDDFTYFNEGVFQDGPIAQAVNQVTAAGVVYVSSAANSGSVTAGTSGTWEGDFVNGGAVSGPIGEPGFFHSFGTQNYNTLTAPPGFVSIKWSDPLGHSSNDYDLFILDSTGTTVKGFSVGVQSGTQDPYEFVSIGTNCGTATAKGYCPASGDRIVVVLFSGVPRALHLDTERGQLSIRTAGATFGHNAGLSTLSTAATYWNSARTGTRPFSGAANPNEPFSSDGPRKIFFAPDGTPITPGNFLFATSGGVTLMKPDIAAADGVSCKTPGFLPFFGTSAAAPHVAAIAALVLQAKPGYTAAQVKAALAASALDSMAPGVDRDSGFGIASAVQAVNYALSH